MSKAIYITYKKDICNDKFSRIVGKIKDIEQKIIPDNISPNPAVIKRDGNTISAVFNPVTSIKQTNGSLCLGYVENDDWDDFNSEPKGLEGTYAVFRKSHNKIQLITDWVGSRTIWCYFDKDKLIASTSQLAIIYYLKTFEFNENVIPWMLSSGTLGPFYSWDKRLKALRPKTVFTLDLNKWEVNEQVSEIEFKSPTIQMNYVDELKSAINNTFRKFKINSKTTMLPLSGGYDSRGILLFLIKNGHKNIKTITWGAEESQYKKDNDAYIAKRLAERCNVSHKYVLTNETEESINTILQRFFINGEGRIDHIAGYMDGFKIWKDLFENNYHNIIRGDEGFGWFNPFTIEFTPSSVGLNLISDYSNLNKLAKEFNFKNELPDYFKINDIESAEEWRDRLYHSFRLPLVMASLNDLKLNYTEINNPLLFPSILKEVYKTPNELRSDKKAFREIVEKELPSIPFAKSGANISPKDLLANQDFVEYMKIEIQKGEHVFKKEFLERIIKDINKGTNSSKIHSIKTLIKGFFRNHLPVNIKQYIKSNVKDVNNLDSNILAFRVLIIIKMNELIKENLNYNL